MYYMHFCLLGEFPLSITLQDTLHGDVVPQSIFYVCVSYQPIVLTCI